MDLAYPPEDLVDAHHPANDRFYQQLRQLRGMVTHAAAQMRPRQVEMVRLFHQGVPTKDIAKRTQVATPTVYRHVNSERGQALLHALRLSQQLVDGPNLELRRNMLWRIAAAAEDNEPHTAITAIKELNKLAGAYPVQEQQAPTVTNITINNEALPRTKLDE